MNNNSYPVNVHTTTVAPDDRGRVTLRKWVERGKEYRVHVYTDGAILLRPAEEPEG